MGVRVYFSRQFRWRSFFLDCENPEDFYVSCWQKNRSALPLLVWKTFLFLFCLAIVIASLVLTILGNYGGYWIIYMTHWGIIANTVATGLGVAVSAYCYIRGPFDSIFGLPWFVKAYWIFYNIAIPLALFITIFYWSFLTDIETPDFDDGQTPNNFAVNKTLDVFIHGANSVLMMLFLLSSKHEQRLMHVIHFIAFLVVYLIFNIVYYAAGGTNGNGEVWIYPTMNWNTPGPSIVATILTLLLAIIIYVIVVVLAAVRDALAKCCKGDNSFLNRI